MSEAPERADGWPERLAAAFQAAEFDILIEPQPVTLSIEGVVSGDVTGLRMPFAVVTGWNPGLSRPGRAANEQANRRLEKRLRAEARSYVPAIGRDRARSHEEPSFAVFRISPVEAVALAEAFGQAAVFYWDGSCARLEWCGVPSQGTEP